MHIMSNEENAAKFKAGIEEIGTVEKNPHGGWSVNIRGILFEAKTLEDLSIIYEVFYQGFYNYRFSRPSYIIDVGMNVGVSSLFFAANPHIQKVYGYEPFQPTYNQALANFGRNQSLSLKIIPNNFGLLNEDKSMEIDYAEEVKGSIGIFGIDATNTAQREGPKDALKIRKESIVLKAAGEVLYPIIVECKKEKVELIMKLDCEGSEYLILENLEGKSLLGDVDVIMMEWHLKGPSDIENILTQSGFKAFSVLPYRKTTGIIFATNSRLQFF